MNITIVELKEKLKKSSLNLIDIRDPFQYQKGTIKNAKNVTMNELLIHSEQYLKKEKVYYIFCNYGTSSRVVCEYLRKKGYQVKNIIGGYQSYKDSE